MPPPEVDLSILSSVYAARGGALTGLALTLSAIGSGWALLAVIPFLAAPRFRPFASRLTVALVASASAVYLIKTLVRRPRPCVSVSGVHALCAAPTDPSFPSGHACGSFTLAAFVIVAVAAWRAPPASRAALRALVLAAAVAIAWSRVYLGVHFPIDVTAGALIGASVGGVAGLLYVRSVAAEPA